MNRGELRDFLYKNRLTQAEAARIIEETTHRPCSVRTFRSWVGDPKKISSRPCPDWVLPVLELAIQKRV